MSRIRTACVLPMLAALALSACQREPEQELPTVAAAASSVHEAHGHDEHADHTSAATATPPVGERWATDAPLRAGMLRVRVAAEALEPLAQGSMEPALVRAQADEIDAAVNAMFADCRLEPAPDAALHELLAKLLTASSALRAAPDDAAPLAALHAVLTRYPELFDDSGWLLEEE